MLHLALARSPIAHADIRAIGTAAARSCEGVIAVITADGESQPVPPTHPNRRCSRMRALADSRLSYIGQPYAGVVARTRAQAEYAAAHVSLQFKPLPAFKSAAAAADALHPSARGILAAFNADGCLALWTFSESAREARDWGCSMERLVALLARQLKRPIRWIENGAQERLGL
jgi:CO/xanthine dehydrogenase Mo-binding subunit